MYFMHEKIVILFSFLILHALVHFLRKMAHERHELWEGVNNKNTYFFADMNIMYYVNRNIVFFLR